MAAGLSGFAVLAVAMPAPAAAGIDAGRGAGLDAASMIRPILRVSATAQSEEESVGFAIPAGSLDEALATYAGASGVQLIYDARASGRLRSVGVSGRLGRDEALRQLLAGTGLVPQFSGDRMATLVRVVAEVVPPVVPAADVTLDMLEVMGDGAVGPVNGYVARRSATATKTGTSILETPQAINVVGRKEIEDRQAQSVSQALLYTPGVLTQYGTDLRYDWL